MKNSKLKYLVTMIFLISSLSAFAQSVNKEIYYTNNLSIVYLSGSNDSLENSNVRTSLKTDYKNLDNISQVSFVNDSMIKVSGENISNAMLNIEKINSISVESGSYTLLGIGAGTLAGIGIGALIISSTKVEETNPFGTIVTATGNTLLGGLSVIAGAVVGGIIGGNITSHNDYDLSQNEFQKKEELQRILRSEGK